ncbi:MAG: hypothetical protein AB7E15_00900 [Azospira sp.]|jgi:hypothetical protein
MPTMPRQPTLPLFASLWIFLAVFLLPMDKAIALRNLVLLLGLGLCLWQWRQLLPRLRQDALPRFALGGLTAFIALLLLQTLFFAENRAFSAGAILGEWLGATLVLGLGMGVALLAGAPRQAAAQGISMALLALLAHVLWMLGYQLLPVFSGQPPRLGLMPFAERDFHSQLVAPLTLLLLAETVLRKWDLPGLLPWSNRVLHGALVLALLGVVGVNGRTTLIHIGAGGLLLVAALVLAHPQRGSGTRRKAVLGVGIALALLAATSLTLDKRWQKLGDSFAAGLKVQENRTWLDDRRYPLPTLPSGQEADHSAYLRAAFGTLALQGIANHPMGIGYSIDAFGRVILLDQGERTAIISSHSSILDFTLGTGLLGLAGLTLLVALGCRGLYRRYRQTGDAAALLAMLVIASYYLRCFPEGHLSGWRLKLTLLLTGLLLGASLLQRSRATARR